MTSRGNERKAVFKSKRDREKFLEYLETANQRYNALIHTYCMMDNHYHLLLETPLGNLPQIMRHINGAYTTYFNTKRGRAGHLFQGRYKAILVDMDEYAKELSRYIHLNPVRAKMVEFPAEYAWSSYNCYIGKEKAPRWLHRDFILGFFGRKIAEAQNGYKEFVTSMINKNYESPLKDAISSILLGSQDFVDLIKKNFLSGKKPDKDLPALRQLIPKMSMSDFIDAVEQQFGNDRILTRDLKMYLCRQHTGEQLKEIGSEFGISESGVSHACRRVALKISNNSKLRRKVSMLENRLKLI